MTFLITLAGIRDIFIIIFSVLGILFLLVFLFLSLAIGLTVWGLIKQVRRFIDDDVKATLTTVRGTAETIKGTAEFVGETAVTPIIKTYGFVAGVRRGVGLLTGFGRSKED